MTLLLLLLFAHALADFPLQGDYLAKFKAPRLPVPPPNRYTEPNPLWPWHMGAHCMIHAGFVLILTHSVWLALAEFFAHGAIDLLKCRGQLTFGQDQALHIACKIVWVVVLVGLS